MKKDAVSRSLKSRPSFDSLVENGIESQRIYFDLSLAHPVVAPSMRANARELERNMKKDSLNRSLTDRPEDRALVDSGKMLGRTTGC